MSVPSKHSVRLYQGIKKEDIPVVQLPEEAGTVRVFAGDYLGTKGPASTFTPINLWDINLKADQEVEFNVPASQTVVVFVAQGAVLINGENLIEDAEVAFLERENETFTLKATSDSKILFLGGEILDEPIFGFGPFVMNTPAEIAQAMKDYENGKMGVLGKLEGSE